MPTIYLNVDNDYVKVFFAPDCNGPEWSVVLQKEPRSRRVEEDSEEGVIGTSGYSTPITRDDGRSNGYGIGMGAPISGANIRAEEVALVDALREEPDAPERYDDMDHVDDDDDDDVQVTDDDLADNGHAIDPEFQY